MLQISFKSHLELLSKNGMLKIIGIMIDNKENILTLRDLTQRVL
jgi:hypothetical protein